MVFTNGPEVRKCIGGVFEGTFKAAQTEPWPAGSGITVQFRFFAPDAVLVVNTVARPVGDRTGPRRPDGHGRLRGRWLLAKLGQPAADHGPGRVKVEWIMASPLEFTPLVKKLFPTYMRTLLRDGHSALVV